MRRFDFFWIIISIVCLGFSGFYSLIISMMRLPAVYEIFHLPEFFKISLVVHVTLSINCWFMITGIYYMQNYIGASLISKITKYIISLSIGLIIISGFIPYSVPIVINYIPLIDNHFFLLGLVLFFSVFFVVSIITLNKIVLNDLKKLFTDFRVQILFSILFSILIAYICLFESYFVNHQYIIDQIKVNLEEFTWGIGHILQFTFIEIGFLSLIKNLSQLNDSSKISQSNTMMNVIFILKILSLSIVPFFYLSDNYYHLFTLHMRYIMPITLLPMTIFLVSKVPSIQWRNWKHYSIAGFVLMIIINIYGGFLGFFIREVNTITPAHYHGSLLAIAVIIMSHLFGVIFDVAKKINLNLMHNSFMKKAYLQLATYGVGGMIHITGLLIMGGYGALRKTPGDIPINVKIGKSIFFTGSLLSVMAGIFFIIMMIYGMKKISNHRNYL